MNAVAATITADTVTMTSLELVEMINATREPGKAAIAHSDFLKKVPKVLKGYAGNFSCTLNVAGPNGGFRQSPTVPAAQA